MFFTKLIAAVILPCVNRTHDQSFSFLFQVEMTMHTARKNQLEWSDHTLLGLGRSLADDFPYEALITVARAVNMYVVPFLV